MLQNIRATAVTVSELLRKNEQEGWVGGGGGGVGGYSPLPSLGLKNNLNLIVQFII